MRPFTMHYYLTRHFPLVEESLVLRIRKQIDPVKIYLLGAGLFRRRIESIFYSNSPSVQYPGNYFLLILVNDLKNKRESAWQEIIEQDCKGIMSITCIVMKESVFHKWLATGHLFASTVWQSGFQIYGSAVPGFSFPVKINEREFFKLRKKYFHQGLNRAHEFLKGSRQFISDRQNKMAAFMLHQSAEQSLRAMIRLGMGYPANSHNLDRLVRVAGLVSFKLPEVFPGNTERDKRLFALLQKAYLDSRYADEFRVDLKDLLLLRERVDSLKRLLKENGSYYLNLASGKENRV